MKTYWDAYIDETDREFIVGSALTQILEDFWLYCNLNKEWETRRNARAKICESSLIPSTDSLPVERAEGDGR